ncbi:MAG: type II secretion system protein GspG [Acidobacteriota bacterium]|nr:type II secretion system protein GspG [Acidobacteriota bacterium]MDH3784915.1 type II secretion system protein GspG [Acidobacteriota bacterium]
MLNALDRAKQKRTMADLRTVSSAIEHYSVDNTNYPMVNTIAGLQSALVPLYTESIPSEDGWSNTYVVDSVPFEYTIASGGKDGGAINVVGGETAYFDDAIIFANGQFYQWPAGKQQ